jgi:hypothetical protein
MNMIRSEQFNKNLLFVLERLQEKALYTAKNKGIEYQIARASKNSPISPEDQLAILEMLEAWKTLTIGKRKGNALEIKIISKKFDELCQIVKNAAEEKLSAKKLRAVIDEWSNPFPIDESLGFEAWKLKKERLAKKAVGPANAISYNEKTGIGHVGNKKFKFKDHKPEYRIFAKLLENINKKLNRYDVLELAHFYEDGEEPNPARKNAETETINAVAKEIRKRTGLNTEQLVMNNGNLTLVGTRHIETAPN